MVSPHQMHQMMPVFHFAQPVMQNMRASASGNQLHDTTQLEEGFAPTSPSSRMPNNTIALAQAVPYPEQANQEWSHPVEQMAPAPAQWPSGGMVQYALVPVAVPMGQHMDSSMPYACFAQPPQMPMTNGQNGQWCAQVGMQFMQPAFCPMEATVAPTAEAVEAPSSMHMNAESPADSQS